MLTPSTCRRLNKLDQIPSVWEGDRRSLQIDLDSGEVIGEDASDCVIWVDGSEGVVRAIEKVSDDSGMEAVVRTLLRAMEYPHKPAGPARPQKIIVKDRELLFFLRGVLQDLDITLDYVPELPLIDELFRGLEDAVGGRPPKLPPQYLNPLNEQAEALWDDAPWDYLGDHQVIRIELNYGGIESFYVSILGLLGLDYGILLYRSLDSLKSFRTSILANTSMEKLESIFLSQDCIFLTYEGDEDFDDDMDDLGEFPWSQVQGNFGSLHPLEGLRPFLHEEEALPAWIALKALHLFLAEHEDELMDDWDDVVRQVYDIVIPGPLQGSDINEQGDRLVSVTVSSMASVAKELTSESPVSFNEDPGYDDDLSILARMPQLQDEIIPDGSILRVDNIPWSMVEALRQQVYCPQEPLDKVVRGKFPVIIVQSTRAKVKDIIAAIEARGGLLGLTFKACVSPFDDFEYELGLMQLENQEIHLVGEFDLENPYHQKARKAWKHNLEKTYGRCGLILAMGATGKRSGDPNLSDMKAFYEVLLLAPEQMGIENLGLFPLL
ncbi:MAG: hypothetical protein JJU32_16380 [Phormidium sp. BM_Day4_Bin.17]|nr:hypothetical protein [Phormidium sp. BM_Day4_Bin.17]UCJ11171.1 MAG: hypothetical protein JWS08_15445 [Phormidium sp. PBR-2020]